MNLNREGISAEFAQIRAHPVQSANVFDCGDETTGFSKNLKMWKCMINIYVFAAETKNSSSTRKNIKKNLLCEIRESVTYWIATSRQKEGKNSLVRCNVPTWLRTRLFRNRSEIRVAPRGQKTWKQPPITLSAHKLVLTAWDIYRYSPQHVLMMRNLFDVWCVQRRVTVWG